MSDTKFKSGHKIQSVDSRPDFVKREKKILKKWYQEGVVDKYLHKNDQSEKRFSFLDGPITANNPMGVHHGWGRTYKDLWQRYKNMKGYKQRFQNGFDCQGLWVEVEVEKQLNFKNKKDIEQYGVADFVQKCKDRVKKYSDIQTDQSKRLGYLMDWENSYFTMSEKNNYMIWHFLKTCHQKGWLYQGKDSVPWCPRCQTALSQHEILTENYKDITHKSIFFRLPIEGKDNQFLLVWTTTPWTIPANISVAVDPNLEYTLVQEPDSDKQLWLAAQLVAEIFDQDVKIIKTQKGKKLVGLKYRAPFDNLAAVKKVQESSDKFHTVIATDPRILPISTEEGTGLVHTAVSAGTQDYKLGQKLDLPLIPVINDDATYKEGLGFLTGKNAKKNPEVVLDHLIEEDQKGSNWVFNIHQYKHRYPTCWRCKTELIWKLADEWYIAMDKEDPNDPDANTLREKMINVAKKIDWRPEFGLDRELDWLNNMSDWLISKKNRYWGLSLPIWKCNDCDQIEVIGSKQELKRKATQGWEKFEEKTPHKPYVDQVKIACSCGGQMTRIEDVGNPWLDAGIVPFSTLTDPDKDQLSYTDDKKYWQKWFPADYITESFPGQFKNWFYSLIAMSTALENTNPFKNVLGFATVLDEKGEEMHKSAGNAIAFDEAANKMGVDVMRWLYARQNPQRNLLFGYKKADEIRRQFLMILWHSYRFFANYAALEDWEPQDDIQPSTLDDWIRTRLDQTIIIAEKSLNDFDAFTASQAIEAFVSDLSTWYIRRSRSKIGPNVKDSPEKQAANHTLHSVLVDLSRILMPFMPFVSEQIYTNLTGYESVNLSDWPKTEPLNQEQLQLIEDMKLVREIVELGRAHRKKEDIPLRQPLSKISVFGPVEHFKDQNGLLQLIKEELNIEKVNISKAGEIKVKLDTKLTERLKQKGETRKIIREIQKARKKAQTDFDAQIVIELPDWPKEFEDEIKSQAQVKEIKQGDELKIIKS